MASRSSIWEDVFCRTGCYLRLNLNLQCLIPSFAIKRHGNILFPTWFWSSLSCALGCGGGPRSDLFGPEAVQRARDAAYRRAAGNTKTERESDGREIVHHKHNCPHNLFYLSNFSVFYPLPFFPSRPHARVLIQGQIERGKG